ncbi:photosystem I reaction center subunit VIII [Artemisia annua]|nr:photosystem I reaction center subunit VIII [Artemisia annua]
MVCNHVATEGNEIIREATKWSPELAAACEVQIVKRGTHSMTTLNFPSVLVPLVGLVFPAIAMASLFLHVQKNKIV